MTTFKKINREKSYLINIIALLFIFILPLTSANAEAGEDEKFSPGDMIMHHIQDAPEWHLWDGPYGTIPLPVILYSPNQGLSVFMSGRFEHGHASYQGYRVEEGHIVSESGDKFYDFSITKNVAQLLINVLVMLLLFISVAKAYKNRAGKAPKGMQSLIEPIILFIRDEIAKPNIGEKHNKYMPYLLTLFFFIWLGNLIGLTPGAANLTGNIAVTGSLAFFTLILTLFSSKSYYWKHIFWPPGVPTPIKFIIIPVEVIGILTKPFSLMIRLFVAITAGHVVLLSLLGLTFVFHSYLVGIGSTMIVLFINIIELLVATIQAYVFTLFTSMYIGMALEEEHH
ncbi:MAG: F0F1 ATP synthase subunit A [Cyclobacteriaceae bacterium]|nr:F0F1 ATP synthase subunit A [Cyclobacteriaceae bacterium]